MRAYTGFERNQAVQKATNPRGGGAWVCGEEPEVLDRAGVRSNLGPEKRHISSDKQLCDGTINLNKIS